MSTPQSRTCPTCAAHVRAKARYCPDCATELPQHTQETQEPPAPRRRWWRSWRRLAAIAAVLLVLVVLATGQRITQRTLTSPTDPVEDAIAALDEADLDALDATTSEHPLAERDSALLYTRVFAEGYTPPAHMEVDQWEYCDPGDTGSDAESERPGRDHACVRLDYQLATPQAPIESTTVQVQRETTGWIREWTITTMDPLIGQVDITNELGAPLTIGGAPIPTQPLDSATLTPQPALLGSYDITVTEPDPDIHPDLVETMQLFDTGEVADRVHVSGEAPTPAETAVTDGLTVSDEATTEITEQVQTHLDDCADSDDLRPANCPMEGAEFDAGRHRSTDDVDWTIDAQPEISLEATAEPLAEDPIQVATTTPGQATATWTYRHDDEQHTATVEVTPAGSAGHTPEGDITYHP